MRPNESYPMNGIDPYATLHKISGKLDRLNDRDEIVAALDELEYLFEIIPPELQDNAEQLILLLRTKLEQSI